jgi:hypothetical protein
MGLFSEFKQSLRESAGRILWSQLKDTKAKLIRLPGEVRAQALMGFVDKREKLIPKLDNMSSEGRIEMGTLLQKKARETFNMNMSEGYALWLTGAWIESMNRPGPEAEQTYEYLNGLAIELIGSL